MDTTAELLALLEQGGWMQPHQERAQGLLLNIARAGMTPATAIQALAAELEATADDAYNLGCAQASNLFAHALYDWATARGIALDDIAALILRVATALGAVVHEIHESPDAPA